MSNKTKTKVEQIEIHHQKGGPLVKHGTENGEANGASERLRVAKAYKMFVGGEFVRSESGRYFQIESSSKVADPQAVKIPRGSRKDARDAVLAAKNAEAGWAGKTAFNRGQILYRLAEVMESRRGELEEMLVSGGATLDEAAEEVDVSIDRAIYYAGFSDKFQALVASSNPVAGPHFGFTVPEPMGIVAVVAPDRPSLLGLISTILPVIVSGNVVVAIASESDPRTAVVWCECLATSDLPKGVVNVLTGQAKEIAPILAKHREVNAIDAWLDDKDLATALEKEGADSIKRVKTHRDIEDAHWLDDRAGQGLGYIERFLEHKSIWHPVGI